MKNILQILVLLSVATFCFGNSRAYYDNRYTSDNRLRNAQEWSQYTYDISEGRCQGTKLVDEEVFKNSDPYTVKKTSYTWDGRDMYRITCIKVKNSMYKDDKAGQARITDGGVGKRKVSIEMISKNSQELRFQVEIWGDATIEQSGNYAILTNTPNKILYMGGKKYCEC